MLLPPGVNPFAVNKYIISYHKQLEIIREKRLLFSLRFCTSVGEHWGGNRDKFHSQGRNCRNASRYRDLRVPTITSWSSIVTGLCRCWTCHLKFVNSLWCQRIWPYWMDLQWWPWVKAFWRVLYLYWEASDMPITLGICTRVIQKVKAKYI